MFKKILPLTLAAALTVPAAAAADRELDPIFEATPVDGPRDPGCFQQDDRRNPIVRGATSSAGQTIIGGLIGALVGNQIGSGSGRDIATGVGAAAGAAIGAERARRQQQARVQACQQYRAYGGETRQAGYR